MKSPAKQFRYHATSMELAADLDRRYVEMRIRTDTGENITVECARDSIFAIQRHIEQMGRECPEISTWRSIGTDEGPRADDRRSYQAAVSEGWAGASPSARLVSAPARPDSSRP
jgi:hypothetical protein